MEKSVSCPERSLAEGWLGMLMAQERVMNRQTWACAVVVAVGWSTAFGQQGQPQDPLAGPKVKETQEERSLIKRNFEGRVQRLEVTPDEAAVELLSLDQDVQKRVRAVLDDYNATLDRLVIGNLELLVKLTNTPGRREKIELIREAKEAFKELEAKGKLRERVAKELSKEQAERYESLIKGYWDVLIDDATQQGAKEEKAKAPGRGEIAIREALVAFGQEIRRSYDRQIAAKAKELEELLKKLDLPTEKETKIRNMFSEFFEKTKGNARPQQKAEFVQRVLRELDKEQRERVIRELFGKAGGTKPLPEEVTPMKDEPMKDGEPMNPDKPK